MHRTHSRAQPYITGLFRCCFTSIFNISSLLLWLCLYFDVSRMDTHLYIKQLSRATPTLSTCCFSTGPLPMSSPWSVHKHTSTDTHTQSPTEPKLWMLFVFSVSYLCITSCRSVTGQNGNTALSIARRLGYISVVDTLRPLTDENLNTMVRQSFFQQHLIWLNTSLINSKQISVLWIFCIPGNR